jgi:mannose-6-phosphate isomerase-like protein (cupin superfamily)
MNQESENEARITVDFEGMNMQVIFCEAHSNGGFCLASFHLAGATLGAPIHAHTQDNVYLYVTEGELVILSEGKRHQVQSNQGIWIPCGTQHAYWNKKSTATSFLVITSPGGSEKRYQELSAMLALDDPLDYDDLRALDRKYGVETNYQSIFELSEEHEIQYDQRFQSICW